MGKTTFRVGGTHNGKRFQAPVTMGVDDVRGYAPDTKESQIAEVPAAREYQAAAFKFLDQIGEEKAEDFVIDNVEIW